MKSPLTYNMQKVVLTIMEGLDSPRSLSVAILMRHGEWDQIMRMTCDPHLYIEAAQYYKDACATDLLRKLECEIDGIDPEAAAVEKWWLAERKCFDTNRQLNEIFDFGTLNGVPVRSGIIEFFSDVKKNLVWLLGDSPPSSFDGAFGPGATLSDGARTCSVLHKMSSRPTLTSSALYYLVPWTGTKWAAANAARGEDLSFVSGNKFFTVPKTALVRRSCAKEPSLNSYYQLGLGRVMRGRLKGRGIDLDDGQDIHRRVACEASKSDAFCTIDLSSASDTVCTALVRHVLPPGWFYHLQDLRSRTTEIGGRRVVLEKFSSMGNGFTFELETAIFTAIALSVAPWLRPGVDLFVYGDDIIVPKDVGSDVIWALKFCGFIPNPEKTFVTGLFRESCGGDFFGGAPVRAHFLKKEPNEPQEYISLANGIRRLITNFGEDSAVSIRLRRSWFAVLDCIPTAIRRCRGPEILGDLCIHDEEKRWRVRWRSSQIRYVQVYRPAKYLTVQLARFDPDIQLAAALYGVTLYPRNPKPGWPTGYDGRGVILRDGVKGHKVGWVPCS